MLTLAYGEATLDRSNVYRWYKMFSEGREDVNDEERAGRPSTSTTDEKFNEVEKIILANRRITVREVAEDLNLSIGSCHSIFINDLGMRRVAAKFVPKLLNCNQKQQRMNIANEMLDSVRDDPNLLQRVITGDEAGVVHHEFLPQGITVNKEYYLQVMRNLREAIRQKRPDLWKNKNWLLRHDNAPAHTSLLVRDLLAKNNTLMMPQPPYSPDLAPCDFFLFPKLKRPMKERRYATLDEIKTVSKEELKKIIKNDFLKCFEDWKNRWHKCIISHGDYFKGDKIDIISEKGRLFGRYPFNDPFFNFIVRSPGQPGHVAMIGRDNNRKELCLGYTAAEDEFSSGTSASRRVGKRPPTTSVPGDRPHQPRLKKVERLLELVREARRITVREVFEEAGISFGSTQSIMKDILGVRRLNAVLVPKDLTFDQKNARKETASLNLEATTDDPELLKRVITGDETWIYGFDSETTQQASEWRFKNEPRPKKAWKAPSKVKVMLTVFFDYQGIVHHGFQQQSSTIPADSYLGVLRRLREAIRQKRPEQWRSKSWILYHDNAPAHTALKISKFLQDHSTSVFPQPPYSPDLATYDFFLFESSKKS
ncbi:hypothetical protein LAZ67_12001111 [Cordylochernes scorpioides]|uniref:Transposase n=1 Tax=Cordylochernes scorpioides TaxID=51811 RepID=A0ABY6L2X2_9ARAC|nr:hypothetical protein LAZ67_12001111 [Cordylochernes scorpioides]